MKKAYQFIPMFAIIELLFTFGCNDKTVHKIPSTQIFADQQPDRNLDSSSIIEKLYTEKKIIETADSADFSFSYQVDSVKMAVNIGCQAEILKNKLEYLIEFDYSPNMDKNKFNPNQEYRYLNSSIRYKNRVIKLDSVKCLNCNSTTEPLKVWAGDGANPTIKAFKTRNTEVILMRGLNFYCNGRYCSNYEVIGLLIKNGKTNACRIFYPGIYPFDFYNTFLFECEPDMFCVYSIKKEVTTIKSTKDFIITLLL